MSDGINDSEYEDSYEEEQIRDLRKEIINLKNQKEKLIQSYDEYLELIDKELAELMSLAVVHGWTSSRIEAGKKARAKIQEAKDQLK